MAYSGLNPTIVLRYLNRMLGTVLQELEINEEEMMRVVFQESLPTYSKFFPYKYFSYVSQQDLVPGIRNTYKLPKRDRLEIIGIHKIFISNMTQFGSTMIPMSYNPFETQVFNDYVSMTVTPTTFRYIAPDEIEIYPKVVGYQQAVLEVKAVHPEHLRTIAMNMRDEFLKLCLYDVLLSVYPLRHRFETLTTPYGAIAPFMDMVDNAKEDKRELLENWRNLMLKAADAKRIFWA
jgi:hypothetical protein